MKHAWKELSFMIIWFMSRKASELFYGPFSGGPFGELMHLVKTLVYDFIFIYFIFKTLLRNLSDALPLSSDGHDGDRRYFKRRWENYKQAAAAIMGTVLNLQLEIVNWSLGGLMVVVPSNMRKVILTGMILQIEGDFYRVVWGRVQGLQYQIGLQRQGMFQ